MQVARFFGSYLLKQCAVFLLISWGDKHCFVTLKKDNPSIWAGDAGGFPITIEENENVVGFLREVEDNKVISILNLTGDTQTVKVTNEEAYGIYIEYFTNKEYTLSTKPLELKPWEYIVFAK